MTSLAIQMHQSRLEQAVKAHAKSELIRCKPEMESTLRRLLSISYVAQPNKSLHDRNTVFLSFSYLKKAELYTVSRVCKSWERVSKSPKLWQSLMLFDDNVDLDVQLASLDKRTASMSRSYYDAQSVRAHIFRSKLAHEDTTRKFKRVMKFAFVCLLMPSP